MRMNCLISLIVALLVVHARGMDGIEYLKNRRWIVSVSVSSTNMAIEFRKGGGHFVSYPDYRSSIPSKATFDYAENNEALILTADKRVNIVEFHACYEFTPAVFKNQQRGFRIIHESDGRSFGQGLTTNAVVYVALSDTPAEVEEEDVEMIMAKGGGWVKYEKPKPAIADEGGGAAAPHPAKSGNSDGIPTVESDGGFQPSEPTDTIPPTTGNHCHVWLYVGISLCALCAVLYVIRRESKN